MSDAVKLSVSARARRSRGRARAFVAVGAALATHAVALLVLHFVGPTLFDASRPMQVAAPSGQGAADERPMEISSIVDDLDRPDRPSAEEKKREAQVKKEIEDKNQKGQVVDIAKPAIEQRPTDSKYLAEYDSKVDHETKGPTGRDKAGAPKVMPTPASQPAPAVQGADGGKGGKAGAAGDKLAMVAPGKTPGGHDGEPVADDGEMQHRTGAGHGEDALRTPLTAHPAGEGGEAGDDRKPGQPSPSSRPRPNLVPTPEMLQHAIGTGSGSMDYLKGLDDGEATALNAKQFKFASFFNRVKRAVAQAWNPAAVYVQHDPSGNVYGVKDRVTVLRVRMSPEGKLLASEVVSSSGATFLDDEAQDAFKRAQPFANVPKELVETNGEVNFTFGFIFELSGRPSMKVYKYQ